jgi:hypothetical protein
MNNKGQIFFIYLFVLILIIIVAFALIEPLKINLDSVRNGNNLNCPDVLTFNQTSYDYQNSFEKLVYRPTCFLTGISMVWFIGAILVYGVIWLSRRKK